MINNLSSTKKKQYTCLIRKRKAYQFQSGLNNPSSTDFDGNYVDPWEQWQNNLNAEIMLIGQEFCDYATFIRTKGKVELYPNKYEYPSNQNLWEYFKILGIDIGHPLSPNKEAPVFMTNAVMALKDGNMSANFKDRWLTESRKEFLVPLLNIVKPRVIIPMGSKATKSVLKIFSLPFKSLKHHLEQSPIKVGEQFIFPVFHSGGLGLANRKKEEQVKDWAKISERT